MALRTAPARGGCASSPSLLLSALSPLSVAGDATPAPGEAAPGFAELLNGLATKAAGLAGKIAAPGQAEVIRHAMQHDLTTVRMAATRAAANLPGQEARRLLGQALQDRDAGVRAVAARVAMTQGAPPLGEELRTAVRQEKDSAVKELMQKAAGRGP